MLTVMEREEKHLYSLDGLKGLSACVVAFAWHYQHFSPRDGSPLFALFPLSYRYGWLMVELFFMLSGFGMMLGYGGRVASGSVALGNFMKKRLKRLYPVFLLSTLLVTVAQLIYLHRAGETFVYGNFDFYHFLLNVFLLQDGLLGTDWSFNAPSWCISILMLLYPLFYALCRGLRERRQIACAFAGLTVIGIILLLAGGEGPLFNTLVGRGLACFSIGVLLAMVYRRRDALPSRVLGLACLLFALGIYLFVRLSGDRAAAGVQLVFILGFAPALIFCVLLLPWVEKFLSLPAFRMLGDVSLEIYLFHFPIQCLIRIVDVYTGANLNYSDVRMWLAYAALVLAAAFSIHRFYRRFRQS